MDWALASAILALIIAASYFGVSHPLVAMALVFIAAVLLVVLIIWG